MLYSVSSFCVSSQFYKLFKELDKLKDTNIAKTLLKKKGGRDQPPDTCFVAPSEYQELMSCLDPALQFLLRLQDAFPQKPPGNFEKIKVIMPRTWESHNRPPPPHPGPHSKVVGPGLPGLTLDW